MKHHLRGILFSLGVAMGMPTAHANGAPCIPVPTAEVEADAAWDRLRHLTLEVRMLECVGDSGPRLVLGEWEPNRLPIWRLALQENDRWEYLREGYLFFTRFENDPRRWEWAESVLVPHMEPLHDDTRSMAPYCFANLDEAVRLKGAHIVGLAKIDWAAQGKREAILDRVRAELEKLPDADPIRHRSFGFGMDYFALLHDVKLLMQASYWNRPLPNLREVQHRLYAEGERVDANSSLSLEMVRFMLTPSMRAADPDAAKDAVLRLMGDSWLNMRTYSGFQRGDEYLLTHDDRPLELAGVSIAGNETIGLRKYRGKVVLLDFGGDCTACLDELNELKGLYEIYHPKGVEFLGIAVGNSKVREWLSDVYKNRYKLPWGDIFLSVENFGQWQRRLGFNAVPYYAIIDKKGCLVPMAGMMADEEVIAKELDRALAERK